MKRFEPRQNVRVTDTDSPLLGKTGWVYRVRISDFGAWVRMDESIPAELRLFAEPDPRSRDIIMYPDQCEAIEG